MTMVTCKECKTQISTLAPVCLHCGAIRRKPAPFVHVAIAVLGIALLANTWMLWRLYEARPATDPGDVDAAAHASRWAGIIPP